ncbi:RNA polymerase sigma-70 factor (ECF subfamily) [Nocardiopsis arvandica]|uniref:RNA polymerase sigma-70 factor (ECF subfamily) n=1 Tax=Nocardiopsis sinuspersici TaxID=501010 RepID=A0A7Z0BI60_9ACTN|nr:RNA polymerase sigma factor [Nocardiopsis sinuspersici]NYH51736.1 RNA polymerase sigma-70 factor (ECF subfamily) [Nocardiopsis sinuspersici]
MPSTAFRAAASGGPEPDAAVIRRSLDEPTRFGEIFRRHAPALHRYAARRLGGPDADDVVAETFHIAFRKRHRYDPGRPDARPWLWRIAANLVRRHHRTETRHYRALARTGVDPVLEGFADRAAERVDATSLSGSLAAALARLSKGDRDTLLLVAWGELTYEETALVLGVPVGTVRSRLHRARKRVRAALAATTDATAATTPMKEEDHR